jgi:hypothetical protein
MGIRDKVGFVNPITFIRISQLMFFLCSARRYAVSIRIATGGEMNTVVTNRIKNGECKNGDCKKEGKGEESERKESEGKRKKGRRS